MDKKNKIVLHFLECDSEKEQNLKDLELHVNPDFLTLKKINNFMTNKVGRIYRLYNFNSLEIMDYSDIERYSLKNEKNLVIFYSVKDEKFETKNILRVFKIQKKLGEGAFGSVYLVEQIYSKDLYAIKYLKSNSSNEYSFLYKEIEALKRLDHDNIIKLVNYCILENNKLVFILEYVSGGSLRDYLNFKKKFNETEARAILSQIVETIHYCHNKKIVHRDLKLENILFTDEFKTSIKLIDFGLASIIKNDQSISGSIRYMPPEVLSGSNSETLPSIDVWSLGCILFELLTGNYLFDGSNRAEIKEKILKSKYNFPLDFSNEAINILELMLKMKESERISTNLLIKHPWIRGEKLIITESIDIKIHRKKSNSTILLKNVVTNLQERDEKRKNLKNDNPLPIIFSNVSNQRKSGVSIMDELNKEFPNYLKPIGHDKKQKRNLTKIKNYISRIKYSIDDKDSGNNTIYCSNNLNLGSILKYVNSPEISQFDIEKHDKISSQIKTIDVKNTVKKNLKASNLMKHIKLK